MANSGERLNGGRPIVIGAEDLYYREEDILIQRIAEELRRAGWEPESLLFVGHSLITSIPAGRPSTFAHNLSEWRGRVKFPDSYDWTVLGYAEGAAEKAGSTEVISVYDASLLVEISPSQYAAADEGLPIDVALIAQFCVEQWTV